jgi:Ca-activated chloride channel family protein
MSSLHAFLSLLFISSLTPSLATAQVADLSSNSEPSIAAEATGIVFSRHVQEVNVAFSVMDKHGRFVKDLSPSDFDVRDNHLPPQSLKHFQRESDLPIRVALLVDASDSTHARFEFEQKAASLFLKKILRPGKDQATIIAFDTRVTLFHDFTDNVPELSKAIRKIKTGGNTALYDAIVFACNQLRESRPETRRAVIVLTDGVDTASRANLHEAEEAAAHAEATLFALNTNPFAYGHDAQGDSVLLQLSDTTGGRLLPARDEDQLLHSFRDVEQTLRSQYALAYEPAEFKPDGSFRRVVIAARKKGLKVQCRKGYFARDREALSERPTLP